MFVSNNSTTAHPNSHLNGTPLFQSLLQITENALTVVAEKLM